MNNLFEKFLNQEVIIDDEIKGKTVSIDDDQGEITVSVNERERTFVPLAFINGKVKFLDEELQELAKASFSDLKDYLEKLKENNKEIELKQFKYQSIVKIRRNLGDSNVAFKCNYCDGGSTPNRLGFRAPCSPDIRDFNIQTRAWCKRPCCRCNMLSSGDISQEEFDAFYASHTSENLLCYESNMLNDWKCFAGIDKYGQPKSLRKAQEGSLAVLTTRPVIDGVECPQEDTIIFGVFLIDNYEESSDIGGYVSSHPYYHIELTKEEANQMKFWKYHRNNNKEDDPNWSSLLHRYLSDMECCQILKDIVEIIGDDRKALAKELLEKFQKETGIDKIEPPNGVLVKNFN